MIKGALLNSISLLTEDCKNPEAPPQSKNSLQSVAFEGNLEAILELLNPSIPKNIPLTREQDKKDRTPLHHVIRGVCKSGSLNREKICELLIEADKADPTCSGREPLVNIRDKDGFTALHYAAALSIPKLISALLRLGANPDLLDNGGASALHCSCFRNTPSAIECAKLLTGGRKSDELCYSETVTHVAAYYGAPDTLEYLLDNEYSHSKHELSTFNSTPLMLSASAGDTENFVKCVELLLKYSSTEVVNAKCEDAPGSAVGMAACASHKNVLKALLANSKVDLFVEDKWKCTPLHHAVVGAVYYDGLECLQILLESPQLTDEDLKRKLLFETRNEQGETPFDIATEWPYTAFAKTTECLITAMEKPENWLNTERQLKVYKQMPEVMLSLMDKGIRYNQSGFHERSGNDAVDVEFGTITGFSDPVEEPRQETKFLYQVLRSEWEITKKVMAHPLVQIYLDLKWHHIRLPIWVAIICQFMWLLIYTLLVTQIYNTNCSSLNETSEGVSKDSETNDTCPFNQNQLTLQVLSSLLYVLSTILSIKEVIQMRLDWRKYFYRPINYVQFWVLIVSIVTTLPVWESQPASQIPEWLSYLAAFGIFTAWILNMREVGKLPLPKFGLYAELLQKVTVVCLTMLIFYFSIFMAFALCLQILHPGKGQYKYIPFGLIKVVVMMTGELDFEDAFYDETGPFLTTGAKLAQLVFLVLVFPTSIVLLNMLIGLTINDVNSLIEEAEIIRLSNQLEQIYWLESLIVWTRNHLIGLNRFKDFFYTLNVTYRNSPPYSTSVVRDASTAHYSQELRQQIREKRVPVKYNELAELQFNRADLLRTFAQPLLSNQDLSKLEYEND